MPQFLQAGLDPLWLRVLSHRHPREHRGFLRCAPATLANVGYYISDTTVKNVLKTHGIEPAPVRQRTGLWSTFLKSHWYVLSLRFMLNFR